MLIGLRMILKWIISITIDKTLSYFFDYLNFLIFKFLFRMQDIAFIIFFFNSEIIFYDILTGGYHPHSKNALHLLTIIRLKVILDTWINKLVVLLYSKIRRPIFLAIIFMAMRYDLKIICKFLRLCYFSTPYRYYLLFYDPKHNLYHNHHELS